MRRRSDKRTGDLFGGASQQEKRRARIRARNLHMPKLCSLLGVPFVFMSVEEVERADK